MQLLRQVRRDLQSGTPFSPSPAVDGLGFATNRDLREQISAATAVPDASRIDPRDLVSRAYALLEQEIEAWRQRQHTKLLPGSER